MYSTLCECSRDKTVSHIRTKKILFATQRAEEETCYFVLECWDKAWVLGKLPGCDSMFCADYSFVFRVMSFPLRVNTKEIRLTQSF